MFRIFIDNLSHFRRLLSLTDSEYVDAILKPGSSSIINDSGGLFGCITLRTECSASDTDLKCRIPRKVLLNLSDMGTLDVDYTLNEIALTFRNTKKFCTVRFKRQDIFTDSYTYKLELLTRLDKSVSLQLDDVNLFCKIGKSNGSIVSYNNGVLGMKVGYSCRVYQKNIQPCYFSILASSLQILRSIGGSLFSIENYVGTALDELVVLATKVRDDVNDEFELIEQERAKFRANINLQNLIDFFAKVKPKVDYVEVNLETKVVFIEQGSLHYEIPIEVTNLVKTEKATYNTIKIPSALIYGVFNHLPNCNCQLEQKRNFVRVESSGLIILF